MNQERVINKVLRDLKSMNLVSKYINGEVRSSEIRFFLNLLWVACWEEANREIRKNNSREKSIIQYNKNRVPLQEYRSVADAARILECTRNVLFRALKYGTITQKGHLWEYKKGSGNHSASSTLNLTKTMKTKNLFEYCELIYQDF